ncbi:VOC family protein [Allorhizocola rhizosphaerae]|uniref:VOC family protein n=1 Tax=Allorhizocola rhizosphaerae TaxID=1872709 RepID=UPI000E3C0BA8|nr:VOC family protein [Allorhizocola rhizosphaerae]
MAHYSRISQIVIDVPGGLHAREVEFWQAATGSPHKRHERFPEFHSAMLPGDDMGLLIQHLQEGESRVHVDIHTDDVEAEVARLEALGAQRVQQVNHWWVMRDPAGLPFCVLPDTTEAMQAHNAQLWE